MLIVTDGQANIKKQLSLIRKQPRAPALEKALKLKQSGIEVFVVAVGEYLDGIEELSKMASSPNAHMYRVEDMNGLSSCCQWTNNILGGGPTGIGWQGGALGGIG